MWSIISTPRPYNIHFIKKQYFFKVLNKMFTNVNKTDSKSLNLKPLANAMITALKQEYPKEYDCIEFAQWALPQLVRYKWAYRQLILQTLEEYVNEYSPKG